MKRYALLICNGEPPPRGLARRLARGAEFVVAADGGANVARSLGVRVDLIIGDLDSIRPATRKHFASALVMRVRRQDNTDLEKALDFLRIRRAREVLILGATGGRVDFTLGNFSVLWNYVPFMNLTVVGDGWRAYPVARRIRLASPRGSVVSIIPFGICRGITLRGLQYPLSNASMAMGEIGVSNVVRASPFRVSVKRGRLVVFLYEKRGRRRR